MSAESTPALELAGLEHAFLSVRVLKGIDLTVFPGEIVGYVGPNGAGKTTTLNIAATLLRPTRGQVRVLGRDAVRDPLSVRLLLALMPEQFGVYDDMRVAEYLRFFGDAYRLPEQVRDRRVGDGIAEASLDPWLSVGELSKGMKQRLFFVRTLLHEPALVLLDEPFSGMDPSATAWTIERVRREAKAGKAFLIASHDLAELERVSTRIVGLKAGRIVCAAPAAELPTYRIRVEGDRQAARATLVARFPEARIRDEGAQVLEVTLAGAPPAPELLGMLLAAGVPVAGFERQSIAIDEIYGAPEHRRG